MSATNPNDQYEFFKYIKLTEDGRLLVEAAGVVNDTYVEAGSVDVPNSELVLLRTDGVEVRIDAAEFLSDAFVTGGVYDPLTSTITFTNNLGGSFVVTGFQLSTTASNGLTEIGNDVQLGGTLTKDTTIDTSTFYNMSTKGDSKGGYLDDAFLVAESGLFPLSALGVDTIWGNVNGDGATTNLSQNINFKIPTGPNDTIVNSNNIVLLDANDDAIITNSVTTPGFMSFLNIGKDVTTLGIFELNPNPNTNNISVKNDILTISNGLEADLTQKGIHYSDDGTNFVDYSVNWDATTDDAILTTKGYVDRAVASGVTASNGLTEVGTDIQLGGTLTQDTNIQSNTELFTITSDNGTDNAQIYIKSDDGVALYANSASDSSRFEMGPGFLEIQTSQQIKLESKVEISDQSVDLTQKGAKYESDYTVNWDGTTPDSFLTTKGYVDRLVQDGVTASNGLTEVGGDIQLGGTLTQDTNIEGDGTQEFLLGNVSSITITSQDDMIIGGGVETEIRGGENGLRLDNFKSDPTQMGAEYTDDYTVNWDVTTLDKMIPSKGYVDREIANATPDTIYTADGSLTGDRVVDTNGNDFKITNSVDNETLIDYIDFKSSKELVFGGESGSDSNKVENLLIKSNSFIGINTGSGSGGNQINLSLGQVTLRDDTNVRVEGDNRLDLRSNNTVEIRNTNADLTQRGANYQIDYTTNWDDTTPDTMLPTKGYVDRKTLYSMPFGRNGNVVSNSYLRVSGNVIANASRGELITQDSKIEGMTYRIQSANSTGNFILDIRLINSDGSFAQSQNLIITAQPGEAFSIDFPPNFFPGWNGLVSTSQMLAIQFKTVGGGTITQVNNPQITLKMSVR